MLQGKAGKQVTKTNIDQVKEHAISLEINLWHVEEFCLRGALCSVPSSATRSASYLRPSKTSLFALVK